MAHEIAIIRDKDRVLLGLEEPENLARAQEKARNSQAHCYVLGEPTPAESLRDKIGQPVEVHYRWKFDLRD